MEMVLESMDLWKIVEDTKEPSSLDDDFKVIKYYNRYVKKVMSVIGLNLVDN